MLFYCPRMIFQFLFFFYIFFFVHSLSLGCCEYVDGSDTYDTPRYLSKPFFSIDANMKYLIHKVDRYINKIKLNLKKNRERIKVYLKL